MSTHRLLIRKNLFIPYTLCFIGSLSFDGNCCLLYRVNYGITKAKKPYTYRLIANLCKYSVASKKDLSILLRTKLG